MRLFESESGYHLVCITEGVTSLYVTSERCCNTYTGRFVRTTGTLIFPYVVTNTPCLYTAWWLLKSATMLIICTVLPSTTNRLATAPLPI